MQCDTCLIWSHTKCIGMSNEVYVQMQNTSHPWLCQSCQTLSHVNTTNSFSALSHITTDTEETPLSPQLPNVGEPLLTSSPLRSSPPSPNHLKVLQLNFNSLKSEAKKAELSTLLAQYDPDVVIGCESKLDNSYATHSIFPDTYNVERSDRNKDGGGVILAIKSNLNPTPEEKLNTSINIRWCSIQPKQGKKLLIGSYYRPPSDSADELNPLNDSLVKIFAPRNVPNVILGGDFNASGISWTDDQSTCNDTCPEAIKKKLSGTAARFGLSQLQNEVTRTESGSCLDLVFTNNQTCVRNINTVDGMGDHLALSYQVPCAVPAAQLHAPLYTATIRPIWLQSSETWPPSMTTYPTTGQITLRRKTGLVSTTHSLRACDETYPKQRRANATICHGSQAQWKNTCTAGTDS